MSNQSGVSDKNIAKVEVDLGERTYPILIGEDLLQNAGEQVAGFLGPRRLFVIADEVLAALGDLAILEKSLLDAGHRLTVLKRPGGESSKSFQQLQSLIEEMLENGADRNSAVVAFGGGVIGDLAGFASAVLLRGVDLIQIPTTLLAQVDSSVGGKTGINSVHGKNLIGSFHQPKLVLIDTNILDSLPERELKAGYAEVIKYGCITDPKFFSWLEFHGAALIAGDADARRHAIKRACEIKAEVVGDDEFETSGRRALLNFGHTFAHGYEAIAGYGGVVLHGEAVSVGMTRAARLSVLRGVAKPSDSERLETHLQQLGLPIAPHDLRNEAFEVDQMIKIMRKDKKAQDGQMRFILWRGIGEAFVDGQVPEDDVSAVLASDE